MSARKLGRLVGLVFALALTFGGVAAAWGAEQDAGETKPAVVEKVERDSPKTLDAEWG